MSDLITGDFDYGSVDEETAQKLEYFVKSGKALYRKHEIQFLADFGKLLSEARDLLANHKNGTFIKWATAEFDIGKTSVYRYMNAWDRILSHGGTICSNWSPTAVYLASSEELPKPVQKKLAAMASKDMVRESDVKRVIEASKPKPEPVEEPFADCPDEDDPFTEEEPFADDQDADQEPEAVDPAPVSEASIMLDTLGKPIPKHLRSASELAIQLQATGRDLDKYRKAAKDFSEQPGGEWINVQDIDTGVRTLKGHFQSAQFHCVCPRCNGKGCERCDTTGWLPEHRKNIL